MTDTTEPQPVRKSSLPCTPPPEFEFHTVFGARSGTDGCALFPGDAGPVVVRRLVTYGDWEPVRPDRWADEPETDARAASAVVPAADRAALDGLRPDPEYAIDIDADGNPFARVLFAFEPSVEGGRRMALVDGITRAVDGARFGTESGWAPDTDRAALRDRIAETLYAHDHPGWRVPLAESDVEPVYRERAAAVLAVLPAPTDPVPAEGGDLIEEYLRFLRGLGPEPDLSALSPDRREAVAGQFEIVRALADRSSGLPPLDRDPVARRLGLLPAPADRAAVLAEAIARVEDPQERAKTTTGLGLGWESARDVLRRMAVESAAVDRVAAETPPAETETVHACPPDGSGLTPCCGRTPFELPRTDRISSEADAITCRPSALAQRCANCGVSIRQVSGTLAAWWVHDPDGHTACHPQQADSPRATPGPAVEAQPGKDTETRIVGYRSRDGRSLYCTRHAGEIFGFGWWPVESDDLPDGGICTHPECGVDVLAQPGNDTPVVAYRSHSGSLLRCLTHAPDQTGLDNGAFHSVTAGDLPDGGVCTYRAPGVECGADVLNPQQPKEA
jgi:hypothetical protein